MSTHDSGSGTGGGTTAEEQALSQLSSQLDPDGQGIDLRAARELARISSITCLTVPCVLLEKESNDPFVEQVSVRILNNIRFGVVTDRLEGQDTDAESAGLEGTRYLSTELQRPFASNMLEAINTELNTFLKSQEAVPHIQAMYIDGELDRSINNTFVPDAVWDSIRSVLKPPTDGQESNQQSNNRTSALHHVLDPRDVFEINGERRMFYHHVVKTATAAEVNGKSVTMEYGWIDQEDLETMINHKLLSITSTL